MTEINLMVHTEADMIFNHSSFSTTSSSTTSTFAFTTATTPYHPSTNFSQHYYYTCFQPSTNLQLVLFKYCSVTKRLPTLHSDVKFFFYSRCLIKNKVCNLIIDNES